MSQELDEVSSATSQDLLFAALNQSGLSTLDSNQDEEIIGNQTDNLLESLQNSGLSFEASSSKISGNEQASTSSHLVSTPQATVKPTLVNLGSKPASPKIITITQQGKKIIKVPIIKTAADAKGKPNIIRLPLNITSTGIKKPIIIKRTIVSTTSITPAGNITTIPTSVKRMSPVQQPLSNVIPITLPTASFSQTPKIALTNTEAKNTYAKVTVGGKKILIPIMRKNGPSVPHKIEVPAGSVRVSTLATTRNSPIIFNNVANVVKTQPITVVRKVAGNEIRTINSNPGSPQVRIVTKVESKQKLQAPPSSGLNLGSLFIESAEKEADIIPTATILPVSENIFSDKNNNSGYTDKMTITVLPQHQKIYHRNCASPLSPVTDILSSLATVRPHSPLLKMSTNDQYNPYSTNNSSNKNRELKHQNSWQKDSKILPKPNTVRETKPGINRSYSVQNFYKNSGSKSAKDLNLLDLKRDVVDSRKSTDELVQDEEREEEGQHANIYAEYKPSKLNIGLPHPDRVVETSSLSSVPPPDIHYKLSIPEEVIDQGLLSALQLETITYACQKHTTFLPSGERAGFLVGDGAGVGKGRTVAGIIFENYLLGRKRALWFSVSNDLKFDSERDLRDIGAKNIHVHMLNKFKYGKISSRENSSVKKGVIFATYSSLIGESHFNTKYGTRLKQILHWCGKDFDGVIIFDECHKAKNLIPSGSAKPTKTGYTVLELQKRLPNARVIYASATGASEPRNMAYMSRIGLWGHGTPFTDFMNFIQAVERRGVGAMELVAMDLKSRGAYIARQLSFHGVSFRIKEVQLTRKFIKMYNDAVRLWVAAREAFQVAAGLIDAEHHMKKTMWGQFWAAHQRFFKYLCIAAKVDHASQLAREAVKHGKCVVIGLQSTGEARTLDMLEKCGGELEDFVSTAKGVFENLIENHFPAPDRKRVTDLFGKDFYKKDDNASEDGNSQKQNNAKRKNATNNKSNEPVSKKIRSSVTNDNDDSASSDEENYDSAKFSGVDSDASIDYSDEDIGKIFGGGSDSDEWGGDAEESRKKKLKKKNKKKGSDMDEEADRLLEEAGLKNGPSNHSNEIKTKTNESEQTNLTAYVNSENTEDLGLESLKLSGQNPVAKAQALKKELLRKLDSVELPNNTLDELIDALGGPENVAEMTGRKGRVVATEEGNIQYESRTENDVRCNMLNLAEKQRFMDGEKNIAIISEAASSGISLQSDRRARNQRRRLHLTLELPWSADRAIQQFGRTHRSNQVNAPEYVFLISELAGEQRFASVVAKRLESLGALTHGDRRATETRDLSQYNFDNKFGRLALDSVMKSVASLDVPIVHPPATYPGLFFRDIRRAMVGVGLISVESSGAPPQLEKEYNNIVKFMNRILGMEVLQQNAVFQFFSDTLSNIVQKAKTHGQFDQGIMDVGSRDDCVERVDCKRFQLNAYSGTGDKPTAAQKAGSGYVELHTVKIERGMSWDDAENAWSQLSSENEDGFYVTHLKRNGRCMAVLCFENQLKSRKQQSYNDEDSEKLSDEFRLFTLHRPNMGKQVKRETLATIRSRYRKVEPGEAKIWWEKQYKASLDICSHAYWQGVCHRQVQRVPCGIGKRRRTYHVLSGSVLAIWRLIEKVLSSGMTTLYKMQIVRLKTEDGKLVGLLIPSSCVEQLTKHLQNPDHLLNPVQQLGNHALIRTASTPVFSANNFDDEDEFIEDDNSDIEDDDDFSPDDMVSSVLAPGNTWYR
uniref:protein strawberry notch homolog 1-like isoform X3 n=1 Tax=Styela clava TaxID=7725 RepID=UPI001939CC5C|nr:protein strawberry notch homolog 1-like isoform X3 [Styela clava]